MLPIRREERSWQSDNGAGAWRILHKLRRAILGTLAKNSYFCPIDVERERQNEKRLLCKPDSKNLR